MRDKFMKLVEECEKIILECGFKLPKIEYSINNRLRTTLGRCINNEDNYKIEISGNYLKACIDTNNIKYVKSTILHEMCHTLPNGFSHGKQWKYYVETINNKFEYNISRLTKVPNEVRGHFIKDRVLICCKNCKEETVMSKNSKIAKHIIRYRCICGGTLYIKEIK